MIGEAMVVDARSHADPVERLYDARTRGVCLISTRWDKRMHLHAGCWVTVAARRPPRLLVAFPKEFAGAALVQRGGRFAVSLIGRGEGETLMAELLTGRHSLDALGRGRFLLAPSGCPVAADAVGYLDCALVETRDLDDFLLVIGDLRATGVLHPEGESLTVNEIQRRPLAGQVQLPVAWFEDDGHGLRAAPAEGADAEHLEAVYRRRRWGLFLLSARDQEREHLVVTGQAIQCSHQPPRMLVCVERGSPAADLIRRDGRFALSLLAGDQLPVARAVLGGRMAPAHLPGVPFARVDGCPVLSGAVAHFRCAVEGTCDEDADHVGFYGPVEAFGWGRPDAPQLRADELAPALS